MNNIIITFEIGRGVKRANELKLSKVGGNICSKKIKTEITDCIRTSGLRPGTRAHRGQ
jgi:hypothetical protein